MSGRVAALALAVALLGRGVPAAAQPVEPPPLRAEAGIRPNPAAFLLPPVVSSSSKPSKRDPEATPAARLSVPRDIAPVSAQAVEDARRADTPAEPPLRGDELFDYLTDNRRTRTTDDRPARSSSAVSQFGEKLKDAFDPKARKGLFRSDHAFDGFVSPVTNPFLFEDPRALTEIRPIFIYQKIPSPQPNFQGGGMYFVGTQARIAVADRFSIVINKLGGIAVNPSGSSPFDSNFGLAEIWLGPKVTIIRDDAFGTLLAAGATFQIPVGSSSVYQNTGKMSIVPYVSYGQNFLRTRLGSLNLLATTGYSFSTDHVRSDYFYASGHLDYDVGNAHRFYPLVELNWFQYTSNGEAAFLKGEGRDLVNFGSLAKGSSLLTWAIGSRFKLTPNTSIGGAFEMPLLGNRDFFRYRFTLDFIWRY
jgi:hypothetical protein